MSIVVATDFSPCSQTAVRLAAALARRRGVPLCLVHAVAPIVAGGPPQLMAATGWETEALTAAELALASQASELRQGGNSVTTRVSLGMPAGVVLETARELAPELLVLGTHGRKGTAHFFLGSVAEHVVRSSTCPVLVTRAETPALERWEGDEPLRLTMALDGSAATRSALSWVAGFGTKCASELSILRVDWPPEEAFRFGLPDAWSRRRPDPELLGLLERDLRKEAGAGIEQPLAQLRFRVAAHDAAEVVTEDALGSGADALVVAVPKDGSSRWAVLDPRAVVRSSAIPVFCIPEVTAPGQQEITPVRTVLVAVDLSDASREVVLSAYRLLGAGGRVELCTVHELGPVAGVADVPVDPPLDEKRRARMESQLRALVPPRAQERGVTTSVSVLEGRYVAETVLAAAERLDVDVVVVGSHGRSGLKRALLGSVAEQIARQSPRPVLLISVAGRA